MKIDIELLCYLIFIADHMHRNVNVFNENLWAELYRSMGICVCKNESCQTLFIYKLLE